MWQKYKIKDWLTKIIALGLALFLFTSGVSILWTLTLKIPDFDSYFEDRIIAQSTKLYDRTGEIVLYNAHDEIRRTIIPLEEIADHAKQASIAIEDEDFYKHHGIKPTAILRAFWINLNAGEITQGGSTITQQVIKNTLLTDDRSLTRKIKEAILSIRIEQKLSKDEILELYLNEVPYGGSIYGIEEAAKVFFGKSAKDINLAESAYLASLPQAPSFLSPYGNNVESLEKRKNSVLDKMYQFKYISAAERDAAKREKVLFTKPENRGIKAPHFVFFVLEQLEQKYGQDKLRNGGLNIITTLDWKMQQQAEDIITRYGAQNRANYQAGNAGLVALDPQTGDILSMVGSVDYFDMEKEGNFNVTLAKRQPGSAFKPFVYASAFDKGYAPETVVFDLPTEFNTGCSPQGTPLSSGTTCYSPTNYDGTFSGPISLRNALAQSKNIPAVKVLYLSGMREAIITARNMGISTLKDYQTYGLTLVLGGGEVTLLEMTSAYGVFANDGVRNPYNYIVEIKDSKGETLEKYEKNSTQVLKPDVARTISDILSDDSARAPVFGFNSQLVIPGREVAVKTGTTNNYRDAWIVGYTPSVVVGAWVGNNDNTPMDRRIAGVIVAPIWNSFMRQYLSDKPAEYFIEPEPSPSDLKPILKGIWRNESDGVHSILYWINKDNPRGADPLYPASDPQFNNWEYSVSNWARSQSFNTNNSSNESNSNQDDDGFNSALSTGGQKVKPDETVAISVIIPSSQTVTRIEFFAENELLGITTGQSPNFSFIPKDKISNLKENIDIKIVITKDNGSKITLSDKLILDLD